jgi:hypothetical protein
MFLHSDRHSQGIITKSHLTAMLVRYFDIGSACRVVSAPVAGDFGLPAIDMHRFAALRAERPSRPDIPGPFDDVLTIADEADQPLFVVSGFPVFMGRIRTTGRASVDLVYHRACSVSQVVSALLAQAPRNRPSPCRTFRVGVGADNEPGGSSE